MSEKLVSIISYLICVAGSSIGFIAIIFFMNMRDTPKPEVKKNYKTFDNQDTINDTSAVWNIEKDSLYKPVKDI